MKDGHFIYIEETNSMWVLFYDEQGRLTDFAVVGKIVDPDNQDQKVVDHEKYGPFVNCNCVWCCESRLSDSGSVKDETIKVLVIPQLGSVVEIPKYCPDCGAGSDDPEDCWSCGRRWHQ